MLKKIGTSLLLAFTMLVSTFNVGTVTPVYATTTTPCTTIAECRELQRTMRDNIAEIMEQEEELGEEIAEVQADISDLRNQISELLAEISELEAEIADFGIQIIELGERIEETLEAIRELDEEIDELVEIVAVRMRRAHRVNNTNSFLTLLVEADDFTNFMRQARRFTRSATADAEYMGRLTDLIDIQNDLMAGLEEETAQLQAYKDAREESIAGLEVEQARLEVIQDNLLVLEHQLQDRLDGLYADRMTEEEMLAAATAAEEILTRTPPPPMTTTGNSTSNNSSNSGTTVQTPVSGGLAHPLPGARVSSEFGPRGGGWHAGIDVEIFTQPRASILAAGCGTVTVAQWHNSLGWYVVIAHNINGQRVDTLYAHLRYAPPVSVGSTVSQGQVIGTKGNTGHSFGAHLHFEVHPGGWAWGNSVNPRNWINF